MTMRKNFQFEHDEKDEGSTKDGGRVNDESSTMTTNTIATKSSTSNINDNNEECSRNSQHRKKTLNPSCPSPAEIISLYTLISHDDVVGIRDLIASLSTSSCTNISSNVKNDDEMNDDRIQKTPMDITNCVLNYYGYTPMIVAVFFGHIDTARCLLNEYGADVNIASYNGQTVLHYAVQCSLSIESIELIQLLLHHSNNNNHYLINRPDYIGNTPLHYANSEKVVRLLLQYGANVQICNNYGEIPLHRAVKYATYEVVKEILYHPSHTSRRLISSDNDDDDLQKIVVNYNNNNDNDYDYDRIHCIKSNNGLTPYDTIIHCQSIFSTLGMLDSLRVRLFHLFNEYEQEQQQIKRYIIYSYLSSCPEERDVL